MNSVEGGAANLTSGRPFSSSRNLPLVQLRKRCGNRLINKPLTRIWLSLAIGLDEQRRGGAANLTSGGPFSSSRKLAPAQLRKRCAALDNKAACHNLAWFAETR